MPSVGERLRAERENQNRTLAEIADDTRISIRHLQAIESDQLSSLPGAFFYKSFVKQYCTALGVDYAGFQSATNALAPVENEDPLPALTAAYQAAKSSTRNGHAANFRVSWHVGFLVIALVGSSGLYAWWQKLQRAAAPKESAVPVTMTEPAPTPAAAPPPITKQPETSKVDPAPSQPEVQARNFVDLSATERTWVSINSDGKTIFKGVLAPAETKNVEIAENVRVLTGNAAGLDVRWKGKPIGPIGERGQVRLVVFTAERFEILPASKL